MYFVDVEYFNESPTMSFDFNNKKFKEIFIISLVPYNLGYPSKICCTIINIWNVHEAIIAL